MQRRLISVILFALLSALVSSTLLYRIVTANSAKAAPPAPLRIYVASHDLKPGAKIAEADLRETVRSVVPNPLWVLRREELLGRTIRVSINKGEPFPENRLAVKSGYANTGAAIPAGMRVVAVHVDEQSGLMRMIAPGDHVDVLSTATGGALNLTGWKSATRTILQDITVFSTGDGVDRAAKSANLLVTPEQAEVLSQAIAQNRVQLILRNPLDDSRIADDPPKDAAPAPVKRKPAAAPPIHVDKAPPPEAQKPAPPTIEIVQGTKRTVTAVAPGDEDTDSGKGVTQ